MFTPINYDAGKVRSLPLAVSQTVLKGYALIWTSGYLAVASSGAWRDVRYVALEDVTTDGSSHTLIRVVEVDGVDFIADCDGVVSIVDRGTYADLATVATVNPDSSTYDNFYIKDLYGGAAEVTTKVVGQFTRVTP